MSEQDGVGRCKKCKWWIDDASGPSDFLAESKRCMSPKIIDLCDCDLRIDPATIDSSFAEAVDGEQYFSLFRTGPDFGCVHWEQHA